MMDVVLIGYSGHARVVGDILLRMGHRLAGYCDIEAQTRNPFDLDYFGFEDDDEVFKRLERHDYFVAVGENVLRERIVRRLMERGLHPPVTIRDPSATVGLGATVGAGVMIGVNASVGPFAEVAEGAICNTASVIEHDCSLGPFSHVAPGAVLAGNVKVGRKTFIGAQATVKQELIIGSDVTIGAGAVIIRDVPDGATVVGNPGRTLTSR